MKEGVEARGSKRKRGAGKVARTSRSSAEAAAWDWDLATGRVQWNEGLTALFGYTETVTDAAWREERIHPDDRERVTVSLQRATIANHAKDWSEEYRFRKADGSYAIVLERAIVVQDPAGPYRVLGTILPAEPKYR